ncbi:cytoskeleton-associated protein 2 [Sander lucioperca]|uniref:cytoskeleton-associated protein 2 n=1 Tax=Sander lucioperca TaxID=283035 RepID=UPI001653A204|nr:cytoskeleton-associated protein 2 [Sander lucioperca]XP_031167013.2 cytoskeleton-associated protein 2 [Sander lucioperca]
MDNVAVSRRNHKKGNKENAQPVYGSKSLTRREKTSVTPFQLASNTKEQTMARNGSLKAKVDTTALKKANTVQKDRKGAAAAATDVKLRQTHSRGFLTEQAVKTKKMVAEAPKPPAAVPSSRPAPGMYKGKIVQSKIGSMWKSTATVGGADPKPPAPKAEVQRIGNVTKRRSMSVADLPVHVSQKPAATRTKSVSDEPAHVSKPPATSRPRAGLYSARPAARTVPATLAGTSAKPNIPAADKKVNKPPVSNALSQYRFTMETAEERRAKLAEWLASKGKTFKRPAMTTAEPSKTKVSAKPEADPEPQSTSCVEPQPTAQCNPEPEPRLEAHKPGPAAHCSGLTPSQTPAIMNTTLDLLENSDAELPVGSQDSMDEVVVNLCAALDSLTYEDELPQVMDVPNNVEMEDGKQKDECETQERKEERHEEEEGEQPKVEQVKDGVEESSDQKVEADEEVESDDGVMETVPQVEDASVIKYSVKTTPYLQSVKKAIEEEASASTSRRKSNIKDVKFLTPVRRSCRIERTSSRLPAMLADHDPCVSSLAELVQLDDGDAANAYIYRKNHALLGDLPDQPRL